MVLPAHCQVDDEASDRDPRDATQARVRCPETTRPRVRRQRTRKDHQASIVKRTIVDVPGAYDLLGKGWCPVPSSESSNTRDSKPVQCGFKRTVIEMEERLTFPVPLSEAAVRTAESRLSTSVSIFLPSLEKLRQRSDLETLSKQAAKEDNERRMKVVLEKIKDDRKRHKEREARRKEPSKKRGDSSLSNVKPVPGSRDWM